MAIEPHFDLNTAFENWRNELAAQPELSSDDRRELEKHLSDSMAELRQRGLSEEEAFWLARRRIGQPQELAEEFEKAEPLRAWRERAFWAAASVLAFLLWMEISSSLRNVLATCLQPYFNLYSLFPLPEIVICCVPFVLAIVLIATGRIAWLVRRSAILIHSQLHLALTAVLLTVLSSFLSSCLTRLDEFIFRSAIAPHGAHFPNMPSSLFTLTTQNMIMPLIFIPLLCLLMPKGTKALKRA